MVLGPIAHGGVGVLHRPARLAIIRYFPAVADARTSMPGRHGPQCALLGQSSYSFMMIPVNISSAGADCHNILGMESGGAEARKFSMTAILTLPSRLVFLGVGTQTLTSVGTVGEAARGADQ